MFPFLGHRRFHHRTPPKRISNQITILIHFVILHICYSSGISRMLVLWFILRSFRWSIRYQPGTTSGAYAKEGMVLWCWVGFRVIYQELADGSFNSGVVLGGKLVYKGCGLLVFVSCIIHQSSTKSFIRSFKQTITLLTFIIYHQLTSFR